MMSGNRNLDFKLQLEGNRASPKKAPSSGSSRQSISSQASAASRLNSPRCASGTCSVTSISSVVPQRPDSCSSHSEALELVKDRVKKRYRDVTKAFQMVTVGGEQSGVLKSNFRRVLDTFCFPLSEHQFRAILRQCVLEADGTVNHKEFLAKFAPNEHMEEASELQPISGRSFTLEEVEEKLRDKILHNVKPICLALRMFDHNQDGFVQRHELRKIIEMYCELKLTEDVYQKLWARYDPKEQDLVDYQEFLKKLALNVSRYQKCLPNLNMKIALTWPDVNRKEHDMHKRRIAILTRSDDKSLQGLTLEQIENKFKSKIVDDYAILKRACLVLDPEGTGVIPFEAFRSIIIHFTYPMSEQLFAQIMQRLGVKSVDKVCWREILDQVRGQSAPRTAKQRAQTAKDIQDNGRKTDSSSCMSRIVSKLAQLNVKPGYNMRTAFNLKNSNADSHDECITRQELRRIIERKGNHLSEEDLKALLITCDPGHTNLISYTKFCNLFKEEINVDDISINQRLSTGHGTSDVYHPRNTRLQPIPWDKLIGKLKGRVHKNYDVIDMALGSCDYEQKGWIRNDQLRNVLHKFCFRVTDEEFEKILHMVDAVDGIVSVRRFLDTFRETEKERLQKWSTLVTQLVKPTTPCPWSEPQLENMLKEAITEDGGGFLADLQHKDLRGNGTATKKDFRSVLSKHVGRLSNEEFEWLWEKMPINKLGNIEFCKLADPTEGESNGDAERKSETVNGSRRQSAESKTSYGDIDVPQHTLDENATTKKSPRKMSRKMSRCSSAEDIDKIKPEQDVVDVKGKGRPATAHPNKNTKKIKEWLPTLRPMTAGVAKTELLLRQLLARRWRHIRQYCSELDPNNTGCIPSNQFIGILSKCGIPTQSESLRTLLQTKYNFQPARETTNYINFLRDFFLAVGKQNVVFQTSQPQTSPQESTQLYSILLDLQNPILSQWNSLKKAFRRQDILGNGFVEAHKFRAVLKEHNMVLPDTDFYRLAKYMDANTRGMIRYNNFLQIFLKSIG